MENAYCWIALHEKPSHSLLVNKLIRSEREFIIRKDQLIRALAEKKTKDGLKTLIIIHFCLINFLLN